jgi:protoporphyrinogen oxidase
MALLFILMAKNLKNAIQYFFTKNRPNTDRIQHIEDVVIKFVVSDMRKIGGFLRVCKIVFIGTVES